MADYDITYVYQKTGEAFAQLACVDADLKARLEAAYFKIWGLDESDFPSRETKKAFADIQCAVNQVVTSNTVHSSIAQMTDNELFELALTFKELIEEVARFYHDRTLEAKRSF